MGQVKIKDNDTSMPPPLRLHTYYESVLDKTETSKNILSYIIEKFMFCETVVHA